MSKRKKNIQTFFLFIFSSFSFLTLCIYIKLAKEIIMKSMLWLPHQMQPAEGLRIALQLPNKPLGYHWFVILNHDLMTKESLEQAPHFPDVYPTTYFISRTRHESVWSLVRRWLNSFYPYLSIFCLNVFWDVFDGFNPNPDLEIMCPILEVILFEIPIL